MKTCLKFCIALAFFSSESFAIDDSKVLPKGVRKLQLRYLQTSSNEKFSSSGDTQSLATPLEKSLQFKDIVKNEKNSLKRELSKGFLKSNGFGLGEAVGTFRGDVVASAKVFAPVLAWGFTDRFTLALAVPIYSMVIQPDVTFQANERGQSFINSLANPQNNLIAAADEATTKINNAVGRLNTKLTENGYQPLQKWSATGLGDAQIVGKFLTTNKSFFRQGLSASLVLPTGRKDDPNNLLDKGFGDGQFDLALAATFDEPLSVFGGAENFVLLQNIKYTHQLPSKKQVRLVTPDESIEVTLQNVKFKLGDKVDAAFGFASALSDSVGASAAYVFASKERDLYRTGSSISNNEIEKNTSEKSHAAELEVSYSTISAFRKKEFVLPLEGKLVYKHIVAGKNVVTGPIVEMNAAMFF